VDDDPKTSKCTSAYAPEWIAVLLAKKHPEWKARATRAVTVRDAALKAAKAASKTPKAAATKKADAPKAPAKKAATRSR
jgi:hypothetical protein